jgi:curved DNA-binding protein CbpA
VLGVAPDADAEAIRAAHRRLAANVHPDRGGSDELARRVNAARDLLLSKQPPSPRP